MAQVRIREGAQPATPSEGFTIWAPIATPSQPHVVDDAGTDYAIALSNGGNWTPGLTFGGSAVGITYSAQVGHYRTFGSIITVTGYLALSSKGAQVGVVRVTGLPFVAVSTANFFQPVYFRMDVGTSISGALMGFISPSGNTVRLEHFGTGTAAELLNTNFNNTSSIMITCVYEI